MPKQNTRPSITLLKTLSLTLCLTIAGQSPSTAQNGILITLNRQTRTLTFLTLNTGKITGRSQITIPQPEQFPTSRMCGIPALTPDQQFLFTGFLNDESGTCYFYAIELPAGKPTLLQPAHGAAISNDGNWLVLWTTDSFTIYQRTATAWQPRFTKSTGNYRIMAMTWTTNTQNQRALAELSYIPPISPNNPPVLAFRETHHYQRYFEITIEPIQTNKLLLIQGKHLLIPAGWIRATTQPTEGEVPAISILVMENLDSGFPLFRTAMENVGSTESLVLSPDNQWIAFLTWSPPAIAIANWKGAKNTYQIIQPLNPQTDLVLIAWLPNS